MTQITQAQAAKMKCPVARTFGEGKRAACDGGACILWRWAPIAAADPRFVKAVQSKMVELHAAHMEVTPDSKRKPTGFHAEAVAAVALEPWAFMQMQASDRGWCGLGGKP